MEKMALGTCRIKDVATEKTVNEDRQMTVKG